MLRYEFPHTKNVVFDNRYILREHGNLMRMFSMDRKQQLVHGDLIEMYGRPEGSQVLNRSMTMFFENIVGSRTSNSFLYKGKSSSSERSDLSPESQKDFPQKSCSFVENVADIPLELKKCTFDGTDSFNRNLKSQISNLYFNTVKIHQVFNLFG